MKEKISLRVKIRRWWKDYKSEVKWKGYILPFFEDFCPYWRNLKDLYWAIRHRTTNIYHKVDTGLKPGYYDTDIRLLHSAFNLLKEFVEEEYGGRTKVVERLIDYQKWTEGETEHPYDYVKEIHTAEEILELYDWWVNIYPSYEDNDPWMKEYEVNPKRFSLEDRFKVWDVDKDGDPKTYILEDNRTSEVRQKEHDLLDKSIVYNKRCSNETENNFIRLIKIRESLWT